MTATAAKRPLRVPSIATLADVLEQLGYTLRESTRAVDRCDICRGGRVVLSGTTAADAFTWLRQQGEIE